MSTEQAPAQLPTSSALLAWNFQTRSSSSMVRSFSTRTTLLGMPQMFHTRAAALESSTVRVLLAYCDSTCVTTLMPPSRANSFHAVSVRRSGGISHRVRVSRLLLPCRDDRENLSTARRTGACAGREGDVRQGADHELDGLDIAVAHGVDADANTAGVDDRGSQIVCQCCRGRFWQ